jgi:alkanesulfonate monooxygenase
VRRAREQAEREGREIRVGLRAPLIVRDTEEEAWAAVDKFLRACSAETLVGRAAAVKRGGKSGGVSVSAKRISGLISERDIADLSAGRVPENVRSLEISPNLWAGHTLLQDGPPAALVGAVDDVAQRLREYEEIGVDTFIFSAYPLIEQAYYVAEKLLPRLGVEPYGEVAEPALAAAGSGG